MEVIIKEDAEQASVIAARIVARLVREKPTAVLGLATGSTPARLYRELVRMHREEGLDFGRVTTFNLDEYVGLDARHPGSYRYFMHENLFAHINIPPGNIHIPDGTVADVMTHCQDYEDSIAAAGGIDLQVLGIGSDGHLGFNEPSSSLASRTRIKTLTDETRRDNSRFFASLEQVPYHCITMGMGTILDSRVCLLLAFGSGKAEAIARSVEGPVTAMVPASALQMHRHVHVLLDEAAAANLERLDYYRWVYAHKPEWQSYR